MHTSKDPCEALRKIRERWPKLGSERLLRVFEATVIDDRELHRVIIARAFTDALRLISEQQPGAPRA
jgi:hypothetical protein